MSDPVFVAAVLLTGGFLTLILLWALAHLVTRTHFEEY